jgi:transposase InsO family protein
MYRILERNNEVVERRQRAPRTYARPELIATAPNQVWSWDITKLKGPAKWTYFYLYKILDIFSRYIVGWMVAYQELASLAEDLIAETYLKHNIEPGQLTVHADHGPSMTSYTVAQLLADLGVIKTHSRPYVSNDNPFSESAFKTLKYRPDFPARFETIEGARDHCRNFVTWYNRDHRHSGIGLLTPETVHYERDDEVLRARQIILQAAFERHPERFVHGVPVVGPLPPAVYINPPTSHVSV